jgi:hypothetical protein
VLQLINGRSLDDLVHFLSHPHKSKLTRIILIPALYNILHHEQSVERHVPLLRWLADKALATLQSLPTPGNGIEKAISPEIGGGADWKSVSQYNPQQ